MGCDVVVVVSISRGSKKSHETSETWRVGHDQMEKKSQLKSKTQKRLQFIRK